MSTLSYALLLPLCLSASLHSGVKGHVGSLTISGRIVPVSSMEQRTEELDGDIGAYRVTVKYESTVPGATNETRTYLALRGSGGEPEYFAGPGDLQVALSDGTQAFDTTNSSDAEVVAWLDLLRGDWAVAGK